ncbi:outer membrane protein assembly factor BamE [Polynucleobacter sp. UB-Siik-W21]|jgi:outer membrane protein assembly factor BamE|nr:MULTISPECIES: outer membrane protein assembly factor BamE [unclassified Polynucleobacter]QWD70624.1 outer membrane protein assembly factor BamE [Polynucleobacter sp. UB-Siik-W21]QWE07666.1 outer membrane protein assembly factor BamE [Polynucleobacter sp. JS-JIR-5-A7]
MQNCLELFSRFFNPFLKRYFASSRGGVLALALFGLLGIAGCTTAVDETQRAWMNKIFRPYVPDIVQGNFISSEQYAKLQLGMTREQVRQILGTPLLASYFHANRWDYVFEFKRSGQRVGKERHVTVFFDGDKVVKFEGDALPTDVELVAEIDNYAKTKRSFWDVMTGSNKPPVTPPLQQPELLVPSPTDNLPKGAAIPPVPAASTGSFWDYFTFSKSSDGKASQPETLGPGAMNTPPAAEKKQ